MNNHICRLGLLASGFALLTGCPAGQNFTTARALPQGTVQHTIGVEALGVFLDEEIDTGCDPTVTPGCDDDGDVTVPPIPFPAYAVRFGITDGLDAGFKVSTTGTIGGDFKIQLIESDGFDFAIDPGIAWAFFISQASLGVMASINLGPSATLTITPKAQYWFFTADLDDGSDSFLADGFFLGAGIGFQIRLSPTFSINPGVEFTRIFGADEGEAPFTLFNFGIGFSFGGGADYGMTPAQPMPPPGPPQGAPPPTYGPPPGAPPPAGQPAPPPGY